MDGDLLSVGNLTRHTLTINDVDKFKTVALAERLNNINCHVRAKALTSYLNTSNLDVLDDYDVMIDCTAKDNVLELLSHLKKTKIICSVSVGYKAEKMYFLYYKGNQFTVNLFDQRVIEFTKQDKKKIIDDELPWDGIGCWNPVFPAYSCDMQLAGTVATMAMTDLIKKNDIGTKCFVYQKKYDESGIFMGYERI
jgi:molybdopterin/thiamine biosynthesis adenylyltransferase